MALTIIPISLGALFPPIKTGDPAKICTIQCNVNMAIDILHIVTRVTIADTANIIKDGQFVMAQSRTMFIISIFA